MERGDDYIHDGDTGKLLGLDRSYEDYVTQNIFTPFSARFEATFWFNCISGGGQEYFCAELQKTLAILIYFITIRYYSVHEHGT